MSISTVTQTVATPAVPPTTTTSSQATDFSVDATATTNTGAVTNPISSISSDLQNYLLQQSQGSDGSSVKGHHHHHHGGSHVDAPTLPGGSTPAVTA